ncbi:MAG: DUF2459 domain-containing protein [Akkermansiaceae bacterium]
MKQNFLIRMLLLLSVSMFFFTSCAVRFPSPPPSPKDRESHSNPSESISPGKVAVYLIADTLHTSLAVPYDWLLEHGYHPPQGLAFPQGPQRYVVMSWGDRVAYVQRRWLRPTEVFNALVLPSPSVTEIIPISWKVEEVCYQQRIYRKEIPRERGRTLAAFLNHSNRSSEDGSPRIIGHSSWGNGFLLDCHYSYYFPRICNVWTAQSLETCGLSFSMKSAISANGVIRQAMAQGFELIHEGEVSSRFGRNSAKPPKP